jgi:RNA polymerase sigma-70 factor (ECF subfamily)
MTLCEPATDADLVSAFVERGDDAAFTELVARHKQAVFRLAVSILGAGLEAEAEEITQEVFLRAFQRLKDFRGDSAVGSWLYRITWNLAVDLKQRARYRRPHLDVDSLSVADTSGRTPERLERERIVMECVDELPDLYRSVIHLHYWMGCGIEEIAAYLTAPSSTVKSYLYRARRRLEQRLAERGIRDE